MSLATRRKKLKVQRLHETSRFFSKKLLSRLLSCFLKLDYALTLSSGPSVFGSSAALRRIQSQVHLTTRWTECNASSFLRKGFPIISTAKTISKSWTMCKQTLPSKVRWEWSKKINCHNAKTSTKPLSWVVLSHFRIGNGMKSKHFGIAKKCENNDSLGQRPRPLFSSKIQYHGMYRICSFITSCFPRAWPLANYIMKIWNCEEHVIMHKSMNDETFIVVVVIFPVHVLFLQNSIYGPLTIKPPKPARNNR